MVKQEQDLNYRALFESAPGLFLALLPDLTIVAVSDAYASATLTRREEITGRYLFDVFPDNPDDPNTDSVSRLSASLAYVLENKEAHTMPVQRYDIRKPDGTFEERYWSPVNKPVLDTQNNLIYIIHRVEDVTDFVQLQKEHTEKKKIAEALRMQSLTLEVELYNRSQEISKLNEILEQRIRDRTVQLSSVTKDIFDYKYVLDAAAIISITDQSGIIQHVNDNFCRLSGYMKEELIGQDHSIISSGHHSKEFMRTIWDTIILGEIWKGEIKNKSKDGTYFWTDTIIIPFLNEQGLPLKYLAIRSDITQRIQFLEELTASEERYRTIYENTIVALFTMDLKKVKAIDVNDVGVALFGYSSRESFLSRFDPKFHILNLHEKAKGVDELIKHGEIIDQILEIRKVDGSHLWIKISAKANAEKTLVQCVVIDITEQIRSNEELEVKVIERTLALTESLKREKELNAMKSHFIMMASHEFRTPLTTIKSCASLIEKYTRTDEQQKRVNNSRRISASVNDLTHLLDDFLILEKLEKGLFDPYVSEFNIADFIKVLANEMEEIIRNRNQQIIYNHSGEETITQSSKILKNILVNLLMNASKYSPDEKLITLLSMVADNRVTIHIQDQGIGIPEGDQHKLFSEFFRAGNVEKIPGTGLGLSIVKKYIELLDGTINFVSVPGQGSTFTIQFPQNKFLSY